MASVVEEAGVGAKASEELGLTAAKLELGLEGGELGEQALDFGEADSVDLLGGEGGVGVVAGDEGVFFGAAGPLPSTDLGQAGGEVFTAEKGVKTLVGGEDVIADGGAAFLGEALAVGLREGEGDFSKGGVEGAVLGASGELFFEGIKHALNDAAGLGDTEADALPEEGDGGVGVAGEVAQQAEPVVEVGDFFEDEGGGMFVGEVEAAAGAEGKGVQAGVVLFECLCGLMAEESGAELVVRGEVGVGGEEGVKLVERGAEVGGVFFLGGGGDVWPAGRGVGSAKAGGPGGSAGHGVLPCFVKEGGKRGVLGLGGEDEGDEAAEEGGGGFHGGRMICFRVGTKRKCGASSIGEKAS